VSASSVHWCCALCVKDDEVDGDVNKMHLLSQAPAWPRRRRARSTIEHWRRPHAPPVEQAPELCQPRVRAIHCGAVFRRPWVGLRCKPVFCTACCCGFCRVAPFAASTPRRLSHSLRRVFFGVAGGDRLSAPKLLGDCR
jgi:hypothetical protein